MKLLLARILSSLGYDTMLYNMACEEEANNHYSKEDNMTFRHINFRNVQEVIIENMSGAVVAKGTTVEQAKADARKLFPDARLIGTIKYDNGTEAGFIVGKLPADFGM